ncbi:MAG: hypothetical protein Q8O63_04510 [Hoeflea sp.]|nr:hypothetical protein [Hoeflea sp.]
MTKTPSNPQSPVQPQSTPAQPDKARKTHQDSDRDVSDPHPGSVSDGTHAEASEVKTDE